MMVPTAAEKPLTEAQVRREIVRRLLAIEAQIMKADDANGLARHWLGDLHLFFEKWEASQEKRDANRRRDR